MLTGIRVVSGRRKGKVECEFEAKFGHVGDDAVEERTGALQTRIGVDLDQPRLKIGINHEIQSEDLEVIHEVPRRYLGEDTSNCISAHLFHLGQNLVLEVVLLGW